ncbi:hypothetical protein CDCA_CDCA07G2065 [Cyanidium caldarium]|uniref:lactoylglutathione lyase n=1 Tax=Cyanidium caldarium TaxID=2771 RepID=A0AAV9IVC0_CYACA|nr:hypothetical protein CDCA_CDCA07G2065 [Cyanidium caldarium]
MAFVGQWCSCKPARQGRILTGWTTSVSVLAHRHLLSPSQQPSWSLGTGQGAHPASRAPSGRPSPRRVPRSFGRLAPAHRRRTATSLRMTTTAAAAAAAEKHQPRFLHAVYRVADVQRSVDYYVRALGMRLLRERDMPQDRFKNAFVGYGDEREGYFSLELTENYGVKSYHLGDAFGHFGLATPNVHELVERARAAGAEVTREPGPVQGGRTVMAFIRDPDGFLFEILERPQRRARDPFCQVMLRVGDLQRAMQFYERALGMRAFRTHRNEAHHYTLGFVGYGESEQDGMVLELTENDGVSEYDHGDAYAQVALSTDDVYAAAERLRNAGANITREPGPLPGIGTKIVSARDPDGHKFVLVDWTDFLREFEHE